jgi:fatty acid desaturase/membrane-associated phospholipid phosphatase
MAATVKALNHYHDVAVNWSTRLWYLASMALLVALPYFWLERHVAFTVMQVPASTVDHWIPFVPLAGWMYLSLYIQLALPLFVARDLQRLSHMVFGFAWITVVSHLLFFFWPTAIPAFPTPPSNLALRLITAADTWGNTLPSLHASLAVYCALCASVLLERRWLRAALWGWTFLILASTLLAKRHELVDIVAGAALGTWAFWALFRKRLSETPQCEAWETTLNARKALSQDLEPELSPLFASNWPKRALEFACFFGLAAVGFSLSVIGQANSRWPLLLGGIVLTALALNAFVLLMHDGMHSTLFRNRRANYFSSVLLGSTFLMSFSAYRILHTRHHKFLGDPRDPDDYRNYVQVRPLLWSLHFVRLTLGPVLYLALIPLLALKYGQNADRRRVLGEYAFLLAVYSTLFRFVPVHILFLSWLVPLLIVGSMTAIRGFTQHGITDATDPLLASRTVLPNPIIGFFLLHENYHLEHHLFPEIPSYHLPRLHRLIWRRLPRAVSSRGYLTFLARFFRATPTMDESPIGLEHPSNKTA